MNGFIKHHYSNSVYNTERSFKRDIKLLNDNYIYNNSFQPSEISFLNNQNTINKNFQNTKNSNLKNEKISLTEPSSIEIEKVKILNPNTQSMHNSINNQNLKQNIINESNQIKNNENNFQNIFKEFTPKNNIANTYIKKTNLKNNNVQINQYRKINQTQNSNYNNYRMNKVSHINNCNSYYQNLSSTNSKIYNPKNENNNSNNYNNNNNNYYNNNNIYYNNQSNPAKINNDINNNLTNKINFYTYINQSKNNIPKEKIGSPNISKQNSFNENINDKENMIKRNKSMSPNPLIYTSNINNYQNNFYVQYTTPRLENLYYKEKIEEIENESINLSILADDLIQGFELDKKSNLDEKNNNKLIEESILQYDNNDIFIPLNTTIKQMRKNIDDFQIGNFSEDKKDDENELSKTLIVNKNNDYNDNLNKQNEFSQTLNNPHLNRKNLIHQNHNNQTRTRNINKPLENNNFNILNNQFKNQININDKINNNNNTNNNNKINNKNINEQKLENKNIEKENLIYNQNPQKQNIYFQKSINQEEFKIEENKNYIENNNDAMKKSINEKYNPVHSIILEVSENKELSMTSKLDLESPFKNSTINPQSKDSKQNKIDDIKKNSINKNLIKENKDLLNENPIIKIYNNNQININLNEPFLEDSDEENNIILKEIINNAKLKELKEEEEKKKEKEEKEEKEKEKDKKLKNNNSKVVFQIDNNVELLYNSNDEITKIDILHLNNKKIEKKKEKNISSYMSLLKSNKKPKSIIKKDDKNNILINENFVMDFTDSSDLEYSPDEDEENL